MDSGKGSRGNGGKTLDLTHPEEAEKNYYHEVNTELAFLSDGDPDKEERFENMIVERYYSHITLRILKAKREKELFEKRKEKKGKEK